MIHIQFYLLFSLPMIPVDKHRICYYEGALNENVQVKTTGFKQIRQILQQKQSLLAGLPVSYSKQAHLIHVLIKPANTSQYTDLVAILDEMLILKIDYYAITDPDTDEMRRIAPKVH